MKNLVIGVLIAMTVGFGILQVYATMEGSMPQEPVTPYDYPENVKAILDRSCMDCHHSESTGEKAKKKLVLDAFGDYSKVQKISKLEEICEVLEEDEMPPSKYLDKKPEAGLTDEEKRILCEWATAEADKLLGQ